MGKVYYYQHGIGSFSIKKKKAEKTIVFLGNSHTMGAGAPPGMSYPDQLQRLCDQKFGTGKIEIINLGRGNFNTRNILDHLEDNLDRLRPDLVVMMIGEPNIWNLYGYGDFLSETEKPENWEKVYSFLDNFKTYRFFSVLLRRPVDDLQVFKTDDPVINGWVWLGALQDGNQYNLYTLTRSEAADAIRALTALTESGPDNRGAYAFLGQVAHHSLKDAALTLQYFRSALNRSREFDYLIYRDLFLNLETNINWKVVSTELEEAKKAAALLYPGEKKFRELDNYFQSGAFPPGADPEIFYREAIKAQPSFIKAYKDLAEYYFKTKRPKESAEMAIAGIRMNPLSAQTNLFKHLHQLKEGFHNQEVHVYIDRFFNEYTRRFPGEAERVIDLSNAILGKWVKHDLLKIVKELKKRRIEFVIQSYPPRRSGPVSNINRIVKGIAEENNFKLSDTYLHLEKLFWKVNKEDYYSMQYGISDSHLNQKGYGEVAKLLFTDLQNWGYLAIQ